MTNWSELITASLIMVAAAVVPACSPPVAPQTPASTSSADNSAAADSASATPPTVDHVEVCLARVLHDGIPDTTKGAVEGSLLARAAEDKRVQGDGKGERETYLQLIQDAPHSPYVPFAYFAFGELFKAEVQADATKAALAEEAYKQALTFPAPSNRLFLLTRYRLGQLYQLENQAANARDAFQGAVDDASANADWDCAVDVAESAQRALEALHASSDADQ